MKKLKQHVRLCPGSERHLYDVSPRSKKDIEEPLSKEMKINEESIKTTSTNEILEEKIK